MHEVDVVVLTLNVQRILRLCLSSIRNSIPVKNIIIVDGGSTDGTLDELSKAKDVILISDKNGTRATSRQLGIENVTTKWFAFVDSDAIIPKDWFTQIKSFIEPNVGGICGVEEIPYVKNVYLKKLQQICNMKYTFHKGSNITMAGLIRTEAVSGIRIPSQLHVFEDEYIQDYIRSRGYTVVITPRAKCYHLKSVMDWSLNNIIENKAMEWKLMKFRPKTAIYELLHGFSVKLSTLGKRPSFEGE